MKKGIFLIGIFLFFIISCQSTTEKEQAKEFKIISAKTSSVKEEKKTVQSAPKPIPEIQLKKESQKETEEKAQAKRQSEAQQEKPEPKKQPLKEKPKPASQEKKPEKKPQKPLGVSFVSSLTELMESELKSFGGWRPNDLIFGRIFHNRKYEQLGELEVVRHSVRILKSEIARAGVTDQFDPDLALAEADFWNDPRKFWFPSAESKFREGILALKRYCQRLEKGEARFYPRSDNLYLLLSEYARILGDIHYQLIRQDVGWFEVDNWFFYARGVAKAMDKVYEAILEDFGGEIKARKLEKLFKEAIADFKQASRLNPLIVLNGDPDDLRANHRLNLASFISDAMGKTITIMEAIQK